MHDHNLIIILAFGTFALIATAILFKWLGSRATGQGRVLGQTIQYSGSIAGFVLVFGLLVSVYEMLEPIETQVSLAGSWTMQLTREDGSTVDGTATIVQRRGKRSFSITGEIPMARDPGYVSFSTPAAAINDLSVIFVYNNSRGEEGVARGELLEENPDHFTVVYADILDKNFNLDSKGQIRFARVSE